MAPTLAAAKPTSEITAVSRAELKPFHVLGGHMESMHDFLAVAVVDIETMPAVAPTARPATAMPVPPHRIQGTIGAPGPTLTEVSLPRTGGTARYWSFNVTTAAVPFATSVSARADALAAVAVTT